MPCAGAPAALTRIWTICTASLLAACGATPAAPVTSTVTAPTAVTVTAAPSTGQPASRSDARPVSRTGAPTPTSRPLTATELHASFQTLASELDGTVGLAAAPVGGTTTFTAGTESNDLAWSTMKVPIAIAALDARDTSTTREQARRAITRSDNDAVQQLWDSLGGGRSAAQKVDDVLREGKDRTTSVAAALTASKPSRYGGTPWTLTNSATFAASLPCTPRAQPVLDLMADITPEHRWGLGRIEGAALKGGWGPQTDGFVTRQLGIVPAGARGHTAVALISRTGAGLEAGNDDLDRIAGWVQENLASLPAGRCP